MMVELCKPLGFWPSVCMIPALEALSGLESSVVSKNY